MTLGFTGSAHALKPAAHADITFAACTDAGLPQAFCTRIATENFNTDSNEWDQLEAHAQIADGETACAAADKASYRLWSLGADLRGALGAVAGAPTEASVGKVGTIVGRALHTIQDNCAHHGMPNPQHAWFSLSDFCDGTRLSPDIQPAALACARTETVAVMAVVATAIKNADVAQSLGSLSCPIDWRNTDRPNNREICDNRILPAPWDACQFLGEADAWDGLDRQWNNERVVPVLRGELAAGLASRPTSPICGGDPNAIAKPASEPPVDVAGGAPSCARTHLLCLGNADADTDENPFAEEEADTGGCSVAGGQGALWLALAALALRRRRQRRT